MKKTFKGKNKIEISEATFKKAYNSAKHFSEFEIDTKYGRAKIKIEMPAGIKPIVRQNKKDEKNDNGIIQGDEHWIENFAKAGLLENETAPDFIKRVKSYRINSAGSIVPA